MVKRKGDTTNIEMDTRFVEVEQLVIEWGASGITDLTHAESSWSLPHGGK